MMNDRLLSHKPKSNIPKKIKTKKKQRLLYKRKTDWSFALPLDFSLHCCWFCLAASVDLGRIHFRVSAPRSVQRLSPEMKHIPCNNTQSVFYNNQGKWSSLAQRPLHSCQRDRREAVVPGPARKALCLEVPNSTLPCIVKWSTGCLPLVDGLLNHIMVRLITMNLLRDTSPISLGIRHPRSPHFRL